MATRIKAEDVATDYPGSDNHHPLKNNADQRSDKHHADHDGGLSSDIEKAVDTSNADTEIAEILKSAVADKENGG